MRGSRRERERDQRRELILEAAERVFGRKPFDEASMQEVAAEARIGMQGLYGQFPSKQGLYESLIEDRFSGFQRQMATALAKARDPMERLGAWALIIAATFKRIPGFAPVFLREKVHHNWGLSSRFGPAIYSMFDTEERRVRGLLEAAVKAGAVRKLGSDFLQQFFVGTLMASLHYHCLHHPEEEVETCVNRAMDCFLAGAGAEP
jgi:AcrR family transcriptional regulator